MSSGAQEVGELAARLNWLFEVFLTRVTVDEREVPRWRCHTSEDVARALVQPADADALARYAAAVDRLRRAELEDHDLLIAAGAFFGAAPEFFGTTVDEVEPAQDQLVRRALRDREVVAYRMCRTAGPVHANRRRDQLRRVLPLLRPAGDRSLGAEDPPGSLVRPTDTESTCHSPSADQHTARAGQGGHVTHPVSEEQMRKLCRDLVTELGILPPLDPTALCRRLAKTRGRRIKLVGADLGATTSVGHLAAQPRVDLIFYEDSAPQPQQAHVIYHEVIHLVRGHLDGREALTCGMLTSTDGDENPERRRGGLYADWQEWEAETGATILSEMSRQRSRPDHLPTPTQPAERGIAAAFGLVTRERRQ